MFSSPIYLWWFLLILPLILLYSRKQQGQRLRVASLMHWRGLLAPREQQAAWRKIRWTSSLVIRLLSLLLFVLASAKMRTNISGQLVGVVLDTSPSMLLEHVKGSSKLDEAKRSAIDTIHSLKDADLVTVAASSEWPNSLVDSTSPTEAADHLQNWIFQTGLVTPVLALESLPHTLQTRCLPSDQRFLYFGDGTLMSMRGSDLVKNYESQLFAGKGRNAAVLKFDARRNHFHTDRILVSFLMGRTATGEFRQLKWMLRLNRNSVADGMLDFNTQTVLPFQIEIDDHGTGGKLALNIVADDDCLADNQARVTVPPGKVLRVGLQTGDESPFLRAALQAPSVEVIEGNRLPHSQIDVLVVKGADKLDDGNTIPVLLIHLPSTSQEDAEIHQIQTWADHPILGGIDPTKILPDRVAPLITSGEAQILIASEKFPLLIARDLADRRIIEVAFDPVSSGFTETVGFPIFVANALRWLTAKPELTEAPSIDQLDPIRPSAESFGHTLNRTVSAGLPMWSYLALAGILLLGGTSIDFKRRKP